MKDSQMMALIFGMLGTVIAVGIAWYVLQVVAYWKIFAKAGEPGWKCLIPFYNGYTQYKITWNGMMFFVMLAAMVIGNVMGQQDGIVATIGTLLSLAGVIINLIAMNKLSKAFGHGIGFTLGLIFVTPIFMLILGFGSSQYEGPQA